MSDTLDHTDVGGIPAFLKAQPGQRRGFADRAAQLRRAATDRQQPVKVEDPGTVALRAAQAAQARIKKQASLAKLAAWKKEHGK